jgi:predicted DNA-binding transcriptional regulator AlpA
MAQAIGRHNPPEFDFVSAKQAARILGVHPNTLCKWRISGGGPRFTKLGRRIRYRMSDISAWTNERTYSNTAQYRARRRDRESGGESV